MKPIKTEILAGGLMNSPKRVGEVVHRVRTESTETIHRLLDHVRASGIHWVPQPMGVVEGSEVLSYIKGQVPHDMPKWIWKTAVLRQVASFLREWHDATVGFSIESAKWSLETKTTPEVICHNDFAPYNCVFRREKMVGLIDFDLCAPGSRLWDMAYTAYRYVPVMPSVPLQRSDDVSPFTAEEVLLRLDLFLDAYAKETPTLRFTRTELLQTMTDRLDAISEWTRSYAQTTSNPALEKNAVMYASHAKWIGNELL